MVLPHGEEEQAVQPVGPVMEFAVPVDDVIPAISRSLLTILAGAVITSELVPPVAVWLTEKLTNEIGIPPAWFPSADIGIMTCAEQTEATRSTSSVFMANSSSKCR
jgi:hypothetical protein